MDTIDVIGVSKRYASGANVLNNVSFRMQPDELLTVLGPSGSGKTTLLTVIAGFETPDTGDVKVRGVSMRGVPPQGRNLGIVFQSYALFPHLTVKENVEFPLKVRRMSGRSRADRVRKMLDVVGLAELSDRRPHELSGGQQQRTALARALVFEPAALLLDEPLGALDRQLREALQSEIKDVQRRTGASILFVTHDQGEALRLSDRVAVIADGEIQQLGAPESLYRDPRSLFVARSLGEVNTFPCTIVESRSSGVRVRYDSGICGFAKRSPDGLPCEGERGLVGVRPESIFFCGDDGPIGNRMRGRVVEATFLGEVVRYRIDVSGHEAIVRDVAASARSDAPTRSGDVEIGWREEDATIFSHPSVDNVGTNVKHSPAVAISP